MFLKNLIITVILLTCVSPILSQDAQIIESNNQYIIVELNFQDDYQIEDVLFENMRATRIVEKEISIHEPGDPWIPYRIVNFGIPFNSTPSVQIISEEKELYSDKFIIPFPDDDPDLVVFSIDNLNREKYSRSVFEPADLVELRDDFQFRYSRILPVKLNPFRYNPVKRELIFHKKIRFRLNYNEGKNNLHAPFSIINNPEPLLKSILINYETARNWQSKPMSVMSADDYWYNPEKEWYKIYLKDNDVYRITYQDMINSGMQSSNILLEKIQLFNNGEEVALFLKDGNDNGIFDEGDYFEFIGTPPKSSPFAYLNIYNNSNIYWLNFQADSTGKRYIETDGYPLSWNSIYDRSLHKIHYEKDSIYERLGHAGNGNRDYWFWGKASGRRGQLTELFDPSFPRLHAAVDSNYLKVRISMHGMTTLNCANPDHKVKLLLTGQHYDTFTWDGPNEVIYEKVITQPIGFWDVNYFQVFAYADFDPGSCDTVNNILSDEIRVNWFELEYWRYHIAEENHFTFKSVPGKYGKILFVMSGWKRDNMKVFVPEKNIIITNPKFDGAPEYVASFTLDVYQDNLDIYSRAEDYVKQVDSIRLDQPSDLRNTAQRADYIIITHPDFRSAAERLAIHRTNDFPDEDITNPKIKVVDVFDIYDEFSYGLLDPYALKKFAEYTIMNWETPAPLYMVLLGDMSYDYRQLLHNSRKSFIPSIPFHIDKYGQSASDNAIVTIGNTSITPEMAIGRMSCETLEEANILVDKVVNYPADNGKSWKQNFLLISSGLDSLDERQFGFNDANMILDNTYLRPGGFTSRKIFRYPNKPEYLPFKGEGVQIRNGFNEGAVIASYYGHGGGYQWDLVFNNDDIYRLNNENRLPVISSVTCYTAHFDNQDVFGEQFIKVPGKGSIGFLGSSALTYWYPGKSFNQLMFNEIAAKKEYIIGKAILKSKILTSHPSYLNQNAVMTYLGDPGLKLALPSKPDFSVKKSDIEVLSKNIIKNDSVIIKITLRNLGIIFPYDSVSVKLDAFSQDTSYTIGTNWIRNFGEYDSTYFYWNPTLGGLYELRLAVNENLSIDEDDLSDNFTSNHFVVFDLTSPNIVSPVDGEIMVHEAKFTIIDNGHYVNKDLLYNIEIDSLLDFSSPVKSSGNLTPNNGVIKWSSGTLGEGEYFWRARTLVEDDSSKWSEIRTFSISNEDFVGYHVKKRQLQNIPNFNLSFLQDENVLVLNTEYHPPKPSDGKFLNDIIIDFPEELRALNAITTDGTYLYVGHMAFFDGPTKIFKIGTGNNGTTEGEIYGAVSENKVRLWHSMFCWNNAIYAAEGRSNYLKRIDLNTGDTTSVFIQDGMIESLSGIPIDGSHYLTYNGKYVYNLSYFDTSGNARYKVRVFDPETNFSLVEEIALLDNAFPHFTGFFVADNYMFPYEIYWQGNMRRINLTTGEYEEEWITALPFMGYYAWTYDWVNNNVYAAVFRDGYLPKISKFIGKYIESNGQLTTPSIGPASKWENLSYTIEDENPFGYYQVNLEAFNKDSLDWVIIRSDIPGTISLDEISPDLYNYLRVRVNLSDTSKSASVPIKISKLALKYQPLSEIVLIDNQFVFTPDTILQGFDTKFDIRVNNVGYISSDSVMVQFFLDDSDTSFHKAYISIAPDSIVEISKQFNTTTFPPATSYKMNVIAKPLKPDFFSFNNVTNKNFFVSRDSINPLFKLTIDGREIISGDIVSAKPEIVISLQDNGPLPLKKEDFTIVFNNVQLNPDTAKMEYSYTPYPNSEAILKWNPVLKDGKHSLEILAKDPSGNFFDSTSARFIFYVFNTFDMVNIYNYPNPFADETHFTFELRGDDKKMEDFYIKVYTIAGRLIRDIRVDPSTLTAGFNRIHWDGRDQDGDEVANGVYFYKIITKNDGITKTSVHKLAKIK